MSDLRLWYKNTVLVLVSK